MNSTEGSWVRAGLSYIVVLGYLAIIAYIVYNDKPMDASTTALGTLATLIIGYYFGSSQSGKDKDKVAADQTRMIAAQATTAAEVAAKVAAVASTNGNGKHVETAHITSEVTNVTTEEKK